MNDERTEGEIQDATVKELRKLGFGVWVTSQGRKSRVTPGIADLFVVGRGRCVWLEMKSAKGRQEPEQLKFQQAVEANGGEYCLAYNEVQAIEYMTVAIPHKR